MAEPKTRRERIGLHSLKPNPGSRKPRKRVGRGEGSGTGKTAGPRPEGLRLARGLEGPRPLRGRPDAAPHAACASCAGRRRRCRCRSSRSGRTRCRSTSRTSRSASTTGADVTLEALREKGFKPGKDVKVKVLAKGEITKALTVHAHAFSRRRAREDRGRGWHRGRRGRRLASLGRRCSRRSSRPSRSRTSGRSSPSRRRSS